MSSARSRSSEVVILMFSSAPRTTETSWPTRSTTAEVSVPTKPSAAARWCASSTRAARNAWGVWATQRSSPQSTTVPSLADMTIRSLAGMARMAAPVRRASAVTDSICPGVTKGRTASWTSTVSISPLMIWSSMARRPWYSDSWREEPPVTIRRVFRSLADRTSELHAARSFSATTSTTVSMMGVRSNRSSVLSRIVSPPTSRKTLLMGAYIRRPPPAARTIAATFPLPMIYNPATLCMAEDTISSRNERSSASSGWPTLAGLLPWTPQNSDAGRNSRWQGRPDAFQCHLRKASVCPRDDRDTEEIAGGDMHREIRMTDKLHLVSRRPAQSDRRSQRLFQDVAIEDPRALCGAQEVSRDGGDDAAVDDPLDAAVNRAGSDDDGVVPGFQEHLFQTHNRDQRAIGLLDQDALAFHQRERRLHCQPAAG